MKSPELKAAVDCKKARSESALERRPFRGWFLSALVLACSLNLALGAQKPQNPAQKPAPANDAEKKNPAPRAEAEPLARYSAQAKRDPFQNLANLQVKPAAPRILAPPPLSQRPPGLGGLLISEVSIVGMAHQGDKKIVVLRGTDKFTYMAREGTKLFDGVLESIEDGSVSFERIIQDTAGNKMTSKVVKR